MPLSSPKSSIASYFQRIFASLSGPASGRRDIQLYSQYLQRDVRIDVYHPGGYLPSTTHLFCFFDGQDVAEMNIPTHQQALRTGGSPPILIVGIYANKRRMQEYGTISQPDYAQRGTLAKASSRFVVDELLPYLRNTYRLRIKPQTTHIAGFSLGGLLAFDIAWHYPQHFGTAGVFSGSLWWRSAPFDEAAPDANRIIHTQVAATEKRPPVRYWFQAGTADETSDRNGNGIIDAIDDTSQLITLLKQKGQPTADIHYLEVEGGRHEPATWGRVMIDFLQWGISAIRQQSQL